MKEKDSLAKEKGQPAKGKGQSAKEKGQPAKGKSEVPEALKAPSEKVWSVSPEPPEETDVDFAQQIIRSNQEFWAYGHAQFKLLSMIFLCIAYIEFKKAKLHPVIPGSLLMEMFILVFFFFIYTLAINKYFTFILWPVSEVVNSVCAIAFLLVLIGIAAHEAQTLEEHRSTPVTFICWAVLFYLLALCVQIVEFRRYAAKNFLLPPRKNKQAKK